MKDEDLKGLKNIYTLTWLSLGNTDVSDKGLNELLFIFQNPKCGVITF